MGIRVTMKDEDRATDPGSAIAPPQQGHLASYNFLLRMSKRMGIVATRSFVEVKQFLNQDITVDPTERFLAGMPRLRLQKKQSDTAPLPEHKSVASSDNAQRHANMEGVLETHDDEADGEKPTVDASTNDLEKIVSQSHEVLAEANTVFPITLFPDTVLVDRTKITIIKRDFFWSSDTMTFRIEDVLNAEVTVGPLFGSLTLASRVMSTTDHFRIDHFWRKDAIFLKEIIQGYVIAQHNKIDVAHLSKDELIKTLNELGHHRT